MMNQQDILKKVGNILVELNEQYQFLLQNPEKLNDLELELFQANANFLNDHVEIIRKLSVNNIPQVVKENDFKTAEAEIKIEENLEQIQIDNEIEERVDVKTATELELENKAEEETATHLKHDFFKPDNNDHTFEFDLGQNHVELDDKFDFEAKPINQLFDRVLSPEEERILEEKKHFLEKVVEPLHENVVQPEEDEIGPEPFLIHHDETEPVAEELFKDNIILQAPVNDVETIAEFEKPAVSPLTTEIKEEKIDPLPKTTIEDKPLFTPTAIPVIDQNLTVDQESKPTLNDLLALNNNNQSTTFASPIADLKQGINLNEKLLFIKDLFNGYNLAYSEAIDLINKMNSFETADSFLKSNYAIKNAWADKQATVDRFYEILNRRFLKD